MKKKDKGEFKALRKKAEEMVENVEEFDTLGDIQRLIHELKIHQVELEIQNEELRQTQVELADSRDRYYDLFDFAPVGYFTIGKEGIIEEINLTACKMFGVDRSKTHKMKSFTDFVDDSDTHKYLDLKDTIFIKKKATSLELTLKKKNDDLLHVQISSSYFFDEQQNRDFMRSAIINITAQKAAELALQESEEKFRILSENAATMIGIIQDNKFVYANPFASIVLGYTLEEITGMKIKDFIHPDFQAMILQRFRKRMQGESVPGRYNFKCLTKNGEERWLDISVAKTRFRGKPAIIGSAVDITDQKKFEEELQHASNLLKEKVQERTSELEASNKSLRDEITERKHIEKVLKDYTEKLEMTNKELKDFAFIASHDMREPLRKISQFGDLISSKFAPLLDEKGQDYFQRMIDAANRMQELLDDLLQYSRVSQYDILFKTVDLNKIIDQVSADYDLAIQDKKATLQVDELLDIKADPTQIYQLFQNLIDNALKFGNEKPVEINIHGELIPANDENAEVEYAIFVEDNGPGFDKKHNEEIFAPFKRLYGRGKYTGTGMGLALCRKIVERHNGKITVESEPGEGTTFKIVLPLRQ